MDACTASLDASGCHAESGVNVRLRKSMSIALIAFMGAGGLNGTLSASCEIPAESHEISLPSLCCVDKPCAMTGDGSPLRYCVKSWPIFTRSEAESLCGTRRPLRVTWLSPGCCKG